MSLLESDLIPMTDPHDLTRRLQKDNGSKIVLVVGDGLGGLPLEPGGKTELETAHTPNLDALASRGTLGLSIPVLPGIAPGSGPGHLGLFGYDPVKYQIGRGVLEALGIDFALGPNDVAIRGNFCTIDAAGNITDRRAGRIPTEVGSKLSAKLNEIKIPGVEVVDLFLEFAHFFEQLVVVSVWVRHLGRDLVVAVEHCLSFSNALLHVLEDGLLWIEIWLLSEHAHGVAG